MTRTIEDPRMTESMLVLGLDGETVGEMRVRKTREGKPKSRNGCRTCKYVSSFFFCFSQYPLSLLSQLLSIIQKKRVKQTKGEAKEPQENFVY